MRSWSWSTTKERSEFLNKALNATHGAGGHGIVVADILRQMHRCHAGIKPVGFIDDDLSIVGKIIMDLNVCGADFKDVKNEFDAVIVAIGNNRKRKRIFEQLQNEGVQFATACHPSAIIADNVQIGEGSMICAGVIVNPAAQIGSNVILNTGCTIDHHNVIGDHVHIAPGINLGGEVHIGEGTLVGIGATVLPGRKIGSWCDLLGRIQIHLRTAAMYSAKLGPNFASNARSSGLIWNRVMYATNAGTNSSAAKLARYVAHPTSTNARPKYIGFLVTP